MAGLFAIDPVAAQTKPTSINVTMTNVYDAFGKDDKGLTQDFGFSCVINYKGKMILFDSGTDARIFEKNLKALKIDLKKIDIAIVSHGHYDHVGGFDYLFSSNSKVKIYVPNDFFSLGAPTRFPFRETEPGLAKTLPKDDQYFRGEKVVEGMITVPTGRFWKAQVSAQRQLLGLLLRPSFDRLSGQFAYLWPGLRIRSPAAVPQSGSWSIPPT